MATKTNNEKSLNLKLHIFSLCCLAIAHPLLDIVSKNAELLVARQTSVADLAILIFVLSIVIPGVLLLPGQIAGLYSKSMRKLIFIGTIGTLVSVLALLLLKQSLDTSSGVSIFIALVLGLCFSISYKHFKAIRMFCDFLTPAIIVVPVIFAFNSEISRVVANSEEFDISITGAENAIPIVMVIFDEFPLLSLLDETANIDAVRYPNFAELAANSNWFRNAKSPSSSTVIAIPAILSGEIKPTALPIAVDYPVNLFTLLSASHEFNVTEQVTSLCPASACNAAEIESSPPVRQRLKGFFSDLAIVYLYVLLPEDLSDNLPAISQSWGNFAANDDSGNTPSSASRYSQFTHFVDSITVTDKPGLYFYHALLPHVSWEYLPSGKYYSHGNDVPGLDFTTETWGNDTRLVEQGYQRHLLQVEFADRLLGELVAKLKSENLYDESLIVIASDHGVNFWPGETRRGFFDEEVELDIFGITLFVKQPNQSEGVVYDHEVSSLDILPTIVNSLAVHTAVQFQGSDLFNPVGGVSTTSTNPYLNYGSLQRKLRLFGSANYAKFFGLGEFSQLVGQIRSDFNIKMSNTLSYSIDQQSMLADVDLGDSFIPARLTGEIIGSSANEGNIDLAVMLNGKIVATGRSYVNSEETKISIMLPEDEIENGVNEIELFKILGSINSNIQLEQIKNLRSSFYQYTQEGNLQSVSAGESKNTEITMSPGHVSGYVDRIELNGDFVKIFGWAANLQASEPAEFLVLDIAGELFYLGSPESSRIDVAAAFDDSSIENSGYIFEVRMSKFQGEESLDIKVIGVSGSEASILNSNFDLGERLSALIGE